MLFDFNCCFVFCYWFCFWQELKLCRVWIIALHFANCEVNSSYCKCKVVNHEKNAKHFFPKENLIHPHYIFPHHIQIISTFYSSIAYSFYEKKYSLHPNLYQKMGKNASHFLKKKICLQRAKILAVARTFIAKWVWNNNLNAVMASKWAWLSKVYFMSILHSFFSLRKLQKSLFGKSYKECEWHKWILLLFNFVVLTTTLCSFPPLAIPCLLNNIVSSVCNWNLMVMHRTHVFGLLTVF